MGEKLSLCFEILRVGLIFFSREIEGKGGQMFAKLTASKLQHLGPSERFTGSVNTFLQKGHLSRSPTCNWERPRISTLDN